MDERLWTYPRIYVQTDLKAETVIDLSPAHAHYFKNVLRRQDGNNIRLFNTRDGEWLGTLINLSKKSGQVELLKQTRTQDEKNTHTRLFFAPIKKSRMDILIEKAVELGVTDIHPILSARTENRKLKTERIQTQIIEAAEQCERLTIPVLHPMIKLESLPKDISIHACIERDDERETSPFINTIKTDNTAFLIGPEGGFTDEETSKLCAQSNITAISLGDRIYRAETASIICLTQSMLQSVK